MKSVVVPEGSFKVFGAYAPKRIDEVFEQLFLFFLQGTIITYTDIFRGRNLDL